MHPNSLSSCPSTPPNSKPTMDTELHWDINHHHRIVVSHRSVYKIFQQNSSPSFYIAFIITSPKIIHNCSHLSSHFISNQSHTTPCITFSDLNLSPLQFPYPWVHCDSHIHFSFLHLMCSPFIDVVTSLTTNQSPHGSFLQDVHTLTFSPACHCYPLWL